MACERRAAAFLCAVLAALWASTLAAAAAEATSATLAEKGEGARFVLELSEEVETRAFVVSGPPRLVVDLDGVAFDLPGGVGGGGAGPVRSWRFGTMEAGGRLVFDLAQPALVTAKFHLPPLAGASGRLVIELTPVDEARFAAAVEAATADVRAPAVAAAAAPQHVVVLDPGHGGIDPGAVTQSGVQEKDVVMAFAGRLQTRLDAYPGITVRLTRSDDRFLSLARRIRIARAFGADLFISIHADAAPQDYVRGATVYTLSERASDAQAAALAARENLADEVAGVIEPESRADVSGILADFMRRETKALSHAFARDLIGSLERAVPLNTNPLRSARFRVLMAHDIPSVLLELGYLTNADDTVSLLDDAWQERASEAVAEAVAHHFAGGGLSQADRAAAPSAQNRVGFATDDAGPARN